MIDAHAGHADHIRMVMAVAMVATGIAAAIWPRCFAGAAGYFARSSNVAPPERARLDRVVEAREQAEGLSTAYGRYLGLAAIALAGLEAFRSVPPIVPYALFCLAGAFVTLLAYLQFRRATEQRVAPLVRRSPLAALPPLLIAGIGCSFLVSLALTTNGAQRLGAVIVAAATLLLGAIAWRIAASPALLGGLDPQYEYAVDERVRLGRARTVAALACAPVLVLVGLADPSLPQQYGLFGSVALWIVVAAFLVTLGASLLPLRQRLVVA